MATSCPATAATSARAFRASQKVCQRAAGLQSAVRRRSEAGLRAAHKFAVERGLKPDTEEYFKYCDDALDMYAKDYGMRYDPIRKSPAPKRSLRDERLELRRI